MPILRNAMLIIKMKKVLGVRKIDKFLILLIECCIAVNVLRM